MFDVIIFSHGDLAAGLLHAAELILGKQERVHVFSVQENCDLDLLKYQIQDYLLSAKEKNSDVLILTDLFFGTPFNIINPMMENFSFQHVTGVNLPFLIELFSNRQELTVRNAVVECVPVGKESIIDCVNYFNLRLDGSY